MIDHNKRLRSNNLPFWYSFKVGDGGEEVIVESLTSAPIQVWVY